MLSFSSHFTQNKVSTRNPRHSGSIDIKDHYKLWRFKPHFVTTTLLNLGTSLDINLLEIKAQLIEVTTHYKLEVQSS